MFKDNQEYPLLIAQAGPLEGKRWSIQTDLILGRGSDCDIIIPMRHSRAQWSKTLAAKMALMSTGD